MSPVRNESVSSPFASSSPSPFTDETPLPLLHRETRQNNSKKTATNTSVMEEIVDDPNNGKETNDNVKVGLGGRRLTSFVWNHFDRVEENGEVKAQCGGCNRKFVGKSSSGTSHLEENLKRCLKVKKTLDVKQQILQSSVNKGSQSSLKMGKGTVDFDPQISRNELSNMIVLHEYPLAMVDRIGFRRYSKSLNPNFKVLSRNTIKSDILKDFKEERSQLIKQMTTINSRVAITTDMWTCTSQRKGYMAVTAHFIDDDWVLQNRLIRKSLVWLVLGNGRRNGCLLLDDWKLGI